MNGVAPVTNWTPGIIVLAGGLLIALLYVLLVRQKAGKAAASADTDPELEGLEVKARQLMDQLRELTTDRHHFTDEQFAAEKSRLELAAAAALRAKDEYASGKARSASGKGSKKKSAAAQAQPTGYFGRHPELKGALWGGGVVLFFAVLGITLTQNERARGEKDSITGIRPNEVAGVGEATGPGAEADPSAGQMDAQLLTALEDVKAHPEKVDEAAAVAHELIGMREFASAASITQRARGFDPFQVEHRIHQAGLLASSGDVTEARKQLLHIADTYPDGYEAMLFLGMIGMQKNDLSLALESFERYASDAPANEQPEQLAGTIAMLRQKLASK